MHHQRWYNHGDPLATKMPTRGVALRERLMAAMKVSAAGCWEWFLMQDEDGYGVIRVDGRNRRAHRVAHEVFKGPIPDGQLVRHSCDNPPCINPAHLLTGTQQDNSDDKMERGRYRCASGEEHGHTTLTEEQVVSIRLLLSQRESGTSLADRFGVSRGTISNIKLGKTWKSAGGPIATSRNIKRKAA
jgi:hypothetical protein